MTNLEGIVKVQTQKCPPAGDRLMNDYSSSWRFSNSGDCPSMKHRDPVFWVFNLILLVYSSLSQSSWRVGCDTVRKVEGLIQLTLPFFLLIPARHEGQLDFASPFTDSS